MAFGVLIHVLILPIPKEKSLPFHRLKLTVISKNFRYTSYNFCICDSTTGAARFDGLLAQLTIFVLLLSRP